MSDPRRAIPSVERLLRAPGLKALPHSQAAAAARAAVDAARASGGVDPEAILADALARAAALARPTLRPVINATGVLLHTNLGRATLATSAADAVAQVAASHAALEVDEETGGRGARQDHVAGLLRTLTGAEDSLVVNNNAAATYLAVAGLAAGRDVVLSRGQMVEIGGHFRLPEVIVAAGARLTEVGTTNRTRIGDYAAAISDATALLLRCHPSNFRVVGFTEEATLAEMVALGKDRSIPVGDDIGSGALVDFAPFGLTDEPMVQASVSAGADLVWFSGDKLLGGPQCGILVGTRAVLGPMKRHPLVRALRPDKLTLAGLEATLRLYATGRAWEEVPILRRIARTEADVRAACERVAAALEEPVEIVATRAEVGGGSLPGLSLPSSALAVEGGAARARALRQSMPAVYGRIERNRLLLDLRAVDLEEEGALVEALQR